MEKKLELKIIRQGLSDYCKAKDLVFKPSGDNSKLFLELQGDIQQSKRIIKEVGVVSSRIGKIPNASILFGDTLLLESKYILVKEWLYNSYGVFNRKLTDSNPALAVKVFNSESSLYLDYSKISIGEVADGIFIGGGSQPFYFWHWFIEYLPRLASISESQPISAYPIFLFDDLPKGFLKFIPPKYIDRIKLVPRYDILNLKNCYLLSTPIYRVSHSPEIRIDIKTLTLLKNYLLSNFPFDNSFKATSENDADKSNLHLVRSNRKVLFITRSNARWRRLLNRREIVEIITSRFHSLNTIDIETLSVEDQLLNIKESIVIFAESGSSDAFTTIMSGPGKIIVLFKPGGYVGQVQSVLTSLSGNLEISVYGEAVDNPQSEAPWTTTDKDYNVDRVNIIRVLNFIEQIIDLGKSSEFEFPYDYFG